jgi:anti-sigma factor ChrR (cupin superfamily)
MPDYHPGPELLMDYASGALPEPVALLVASHVSLCRTCQGEVERLEALGGALFDSLPAEPLGEAALDRALARLELPEARGGTRRRTPAAAAIRGCRGRCATTFPAISTASAGRSAAASPSSTC